MLRSFTVPILSKIEITIDFNGHECPTLLFKYSKIEWWIFFKLYQIIPVTIVNNMHYNLFHSVMWVQQP